MLRYLISLRGNSRIDCAFPIIRTGAGGISMVSGVRRQRDLASPQALRPEISDPPITVRSLIRVFP
jgi:hypothetical protein